MTRWRGITAMIGLCAGLAASAAWADGSPFVGRWHWNATQSTTTPGEPVPKDVTAEITNADNSRVTWVVHITDLQGQPHQESFDAAPDGAFHQVQGSGDGTTASFTLASNALQAVFKGPAGETDQLACTVSADSKQMTCQGVLNDGKGHSDNYRDVYDRM